MTGAVPSPQPENLPPALSERDKFNLALIAQDRENTDRFAALLIERSVRIIAEYLQIDAARKEELDARLAAGERAAAMEQYVVPHMLTYPMPEAGTFQKSLTMLLQAPSEDKASRAGRAVFGAASAEFDNRGNLLIDTTGDADSDMGDMEDARLAMFSEPEPVYKPGDRLRLAIPVPDTYVYPEPLAEEDVPPAAEPEMMVEFMPAGNVPNSIRFLIRPNELAQGAQTEGVNFEVVRYVSAYDAGEQHVEGDELTAKMVYEGLTRRMPRTGQIMRRFVELAAEFDVVPQQLASAEGSIEL